MKKNFIKFAVLTVSVMFFSNWISLALDDKSKVLVEEFFQKNIMAASNFQLFENNVIQWDKAISRYITKKWDYLAFYKKEILTYLQKYSWSMLYKYWCFSSVSQSDLDNISYISNCFANYKSDIQWRQFILIGWGENWLTYTDFEPSEVTILDNSFIKVWDILFVKEHSNYSYGEWFEFSASWLWLYTVQTSQIDVSSLELIKGQNYLFKDKYWIIYYYDIFSRNLLMVPWATISNSTFYKDISWIFIVTDQVIYGLRASPIFNQRPWLQLVLAKGWDAKSFQYLGYWYAKDKNQVYMLIRLVSPMTLQEQIVRPLLLKWANADTFELEKYNYQKDANALYINGNRYDNVDSPSRVSLGEGVGISYDKDYLYKVVYSITWSDLQSYPLSEIWLSGDLFMNGRCIWDWNTTIIFNKTTNEASEVSTENIANLCTAKTGN